MDDGVQLGLCGFAMAFEDYVREYRRVEVQQTFYDPPREGTMRRWRAQAPSHFELTIKAWHSSRHRVELKLPSPQVATERGRSRRSWWVPDVARRPARVVPAWVSIRRSVRSATTSCSRLSSSSAKWPG